MDPSHRRAIVKCWTTLVHQVTEDQVYCIADYLLERGILTSVLWERMTHRPDTADKMRFTLTSLLGRGPLAFHALVNALLSCEATLLACDLLSHT